MAASNWAICPRCLNDERRRLLGLREQVRAGYGTLPLDEFAALVAEAGKDIDGDALSTFREDYEFYGATEGVVMVRYSGRCTVCDLSLDITHEHPIPGLEVES